MPDTSQQLVACEHCGTPFRPREAEETFCCHGCRYVSQLLHEGGLERFYELKGGQALPPVGSRVFETFDGEWLEDLQEHCEATGESGIARADLGIEGISCIGCVWLIEAIFKQRAGASVIHLRPSEGFVRLGWRKGTFSLADFAAELRRIGYRLVPVEDADHARPVCRELAHRIGLCAFFLLNTMLFTLPGYLGMGGDFFLAPLFQLLGAGFATLSLVVGGGYFIQRAWRSLRQGVLHIDLPIGLGLLAAYFGSLLGWATGYVQLIYFDFVATFVFLMLVGRWLQEFALERNRARLLRRDFRPKTVTAVGGADDGRRLPVEQVREGREYSVAPGKVNPVAAELLDPAATLSLEWINGEAEPVDWPARRIVPAGAINLGLGPLRFRAREPWARSLLAQLLERPEQSFRDDGLQTLLKLYIGGVLAVALLGGMAWLAATGDPLKSMQVLVSILVVSCPCALGVALPMCDEFATARLRRGGLFVKAADLWERLARVRCVVFDKTGTLTLEVPRLRNPGAVRQLDPFARTALLHLVRDNPHPVARSLREALLAEHASNLSSEPAPDGTIDEIVGQGVAWRDAAGNRWTLGKPAWEESAAAASAPEGRTVLRQNGLLVASFEFEDDVRDDARETVDFLHRLGMETAILSGDHAPRVARVAEALSLAPELALAGCSPQRKADWIRARAPGRALMIGDGANDSLAFDHAVCRGTPVVDRSVLEASADFFFFGRSLRCLPELFAVARRRRLTTRTIFAAALAYNLAAVGLCLAGWMHPLLAAIIMPLSSIATLAIAWTGLGRK